MVTPTAIAHGSRQSLRTCVSKRSMPLEYAQRFTAHRIMMTRQFHYIPTLPECQNKDVAPHIRSCISRMGGTNVDTGFHVCFLGTGGSIPSTSRMTSATLLQLGGQAFLFDAGEGVQRQIMLTRQRPSDVTKIFITHMHADHVLGLPGMLLMAQAAGRVCSTTQTVEVYGPPGIYNYIAATMTLMQAHLSFLQLVVYELMNGDAEQARRRHWRQPSFGYCHYPELSTKAMARKFIERNSDGTWTIQKPKEKTEDDAYDVDRGGNRPMHIYAAEVKHLYKVQTFGYTVQEPEPSGKIDAEKATRLGVAPGAKYRKLKNGFSVMSDDGIRQVRPEQVLAGAVRKARKFACIGDNCELSSAMIQLCMDTDVLVHEATGSVENDTDVRERGHASAEMAGIVARRVKAQVLALNHISGSVGASELNDLVRQAEEANGGVSRVIPAHDFMSLFVPRFGFEFEKENMFERFIDN